MSATWIDEGVGTPVSCCDFTDIGTASRMFLAHPEKTSELAGKRVIRLVVVLITPDDDLENLGADLAPALQRCTHSAAHRPIFGHGRRDCLVGGARIPIAIKNVQRRPA